MLFAVRWNENYLEGKCARCDFLFVEQVKKKRCLQQSAADLVDSLS
jgi:hypothetical protein